LEEEGTKGEELNEWRWQEGTMEEVRKLKRRRDTCKKKRD
jgi:hypothetical protein